MKQIERIGGLAKVRKEMEIAEDEAAAIADAAFYQECLGIPDDELTPEQLREKYDTEGEGQHPRFTRWDWRQAVAEQSTLSGYWYWVNYKLNE